MTLRQQVSWVRLWFPGLILLSLLSACRSTEPTANASQGQGIPVKMETIRSSVLEQSEEFNATLESRQSVQLKPRIEGQVARIFVRAGDTVRAGEVILQIDPRKQAAATVGSASAAESAKAGVSSAQAEVTSAQATLESARAMLKTHQAERLARSADVKFNQQQYNRFAQLYKAGGLSRQVLDQYGNSLASARASLSAVDARIQAQQAEITAKAAEVAAKQADVSSAQRGVQQAQATTESQKVELQFFRITAPFAGVVGDIPVKEGEFVDTSTQLVSVTQNNALEVNVSIPTEKVKQMRIGTQIELLNPQSQPVGSGRVFMIAPKVADDTQTVLVKALVDNRNGALRADQQVQVRVIWERSPGMMVPTTAISRVAGQDFIFVAEKNGAAWIARQKPVKLGMIRGNDQQVLEGLQANEQVITTGLLKISDGTPVVNQADASQSNQKL
jgi:RND family efflux transporter MFP subunit